jgi:methionine synthase II (cobalamin-independent)
MTRDLDRGRTTEEAVADQREGDLRELVAVQEAAGLDLLSDGMLAWQDVFRPLAERCDGLEARPLVRFLDTNTFFRALVVSGRPRLREPVPAPGLPAGRWVGTLPSPYALSRSTGGAVSAEAIAEAVLAPQIESWGKAGVEEVVLQEPFLAREPEGLAALAAALRELPTPAPLVLQLVFGDASAVLDACADLAVDGVGVDFYATSLDAIPAGFPKRLVAGVVDARSSALEDPAEIAAFAADLARRDPAGLDLVPNGDLQFVPEPIAREKVLRLGQARARALEAA